MKTVMKAAAALVGLALATLPGRAGAEPAQLIPSIVIHGDYVRVGDIFQNAGDLADEVVARSPVPGKDVVLDAYWLSRVARKFDVEWQPVSRMDRAILRRDSRVVDRTEIENSIRRVLREEEGLDDDFEVDLSTGHIALHVPAEAVVGVRVRDLAFDRNSGRFSAAIIVPPDSPQAVTTQVVGTVYPVSEVPVLARRMTSDEVIRGSDIEWVKLRADRLGRNIVVDADNLIGKSPRRPIHPGRAIRSTDVEQPVLVEKNSLVTMEVLRPGMRLTARGKAMDSGGEGDTVRISNLQSNVVVEAIVTGPGKVAVTPVDRIALN